MAAADSVWTRTTRRIRVDRAVADLDGWTDDESHVASILDDDNPLRFLLVEHSTRDDRYWLSLHDTRDDAYRHSADQEYGRDWSIDYVVDLDTGARWTVLTTSAVWEVVAS